MIAKPALSFYWAVAFVSLFGFRILGQEPQPAVKPVESQTANQPQLITSMTVESFQRILQGMGFEATRDKDDKGQPTGYLMFRAEGYKVGAQVPSPEFIWLYNVFTDTTTLETINSWNQSNRFSRAYLNTSDKTLCLETEIIVTGGITRENIESQVKEFRDSVARWARFVIDHGDTKTSTPPKQ
jgi:hypothetical protein